MNERATASQCGEIAQIVAMSVGQPIPIHLPRSEEKHPTFAEEFGWDYRDNTDLVRLDIGQWQEGAPGS
jgi:hypothetical protein